MPRAFILTAIPEEYQAVRDYLTHLKNDPENPERYEHGRFKAEGRTWDVTIAQSGQGNINAAIATTALNDFQPNIALFVGIAGGIPGKDIRLGDVVAVDTAYDYETSKIEEGNTKPRGNPEYSTENLIKLASQLAAQEDWQQRIREKKRHINLKVLIKPVASGEIVVGSTQSPEFRYIRQCFSDAVAVEKEGVGFLRVFRKSEYKNIPAIVIRGISDLIDDKENAEKAGYREIAASHASAFAFELLAKFEPKLVVPSQPDEFMRKLSRYLNSGDYCCCYVLSSPESAKNDILRSILEKFNVLPQQVIVINEKEITQRLTRERKVSDIENFEEFYKTLAKIIQANLNIPSDYWWNNIKAKSGNKTAKEIFKQSLNYIIKWHCDRLIIIIENLEKIFSVSQEDETKRLLVLEHQEEFLTVIDESIELLVKNSLNNQKSLKFLMIDECLAENDWQYHYPQPIKLGWRINWTANAKNKITPFSQILDDQFQDIDSEKLLASILAWTEGHPLWTKKLFQQIFTSDAPLNPEQEENDVDRLVKEIIQDKIFENILKEFEEKLL